MRDHAFSLIDVTDAPPTRDDPAANWRRPFQRLDSILAATLEQARLTFGPEAGHDAFRGLYITQEQADLALRHPPGDPVLRPAVPGPMVPDWDSIVAQHRGWAWLRETAGLNATELDAVLIALAPRPICGPSGSTAISRTT